MRNYMMTLGIAVLMFAPVSVCAQDEPPIEEEAESQLVDKSDQTGTNPINFTFDLRLYNEYQWLNVDGDGKQNTTTLELRVPFADGKWQFRVRARGNYVNADLPDAGRSPGMFARRDRARSGGFLRRARGFLGSDRGIDDCGFGDVDFRLLTVPYFNVEKKMAIATGLEVFLDTASEDSLGSGSYSLGPQVFAVFFKPFGLNLDLFAPAYQHKFDVDGNDVNQGLIDLFILKTSADKTLWLLLDPQIVLDYENDREFSLIDVEFGTMLDKYLGTKGHSFYVRPSVGIGNDRPYDASIEVGYKIVW